MVFALQIVPIQVTLIPLLTLYVDAGLAGTFWTIWLSHSTFALPLAIFLLHNFMKEIPRELIEAARVDGASAIQAFFHHTLPLLRPVLLVAVVLRTIDAVGTFDQIYVLTKGGPGTATQLISIYAYNTAFLFNQYGRAMAMLIGLLACLLVLMAAAVHFMQRSSEVIE
jgi:alpha-glucoside transport system permease protein